ncbi:helix-turn-helix domain-containing protein [Novosphingobium sp. KACC 22771]|uniref:AraC-like ligand-binding domain-containing protein n=1 Tax=Novosphingobium sp. KACC 22771 TaxID=3025670 RepID=UPI0023651EBC|nr:helix-turn-helix domain-containing protein [Novosphingobium sp. KACC 22771]WDF74535.1 helix-turn-helix domain-containing protein [Novosphingobium sp. KACC 22771]
MAASKHFTTAGLSGTEAAEAWALHWRSLVPLRVRSLGAEGLRADVRTRALSSLSVGRIAVGPHEIQRERAAPQDASGDLLKLVIQLSGSTIVEQAGHQVALESGQWLLYDMARSYRLTNEAATGQFALIVPRSAYAGLADTARRIAMRPRPVSGMVKLLQRCTQGVIDDLDEGENALLDSDLGATMVDMLRLALGECGEGIARSSMQDTMRERVMAYIRRNFRDPDLTLDAVAQAMHCTKRYLHKLFCDDQTISECIWAMRVRRCGEELASPAYTARSITEIAFANGFSNSAHFSRVFKTHYGTSPRTYRAARTGH